MNSTAGYTVLQQRLHAVVIIMLVFQYLLQAPMRHAMQQLEQQLVLSAGGFLVTTAHSLVGLMIAGIVAWRLYLRRQKPVAPGAGQLSPLACNLAVGLHRALYGLLLFMAVSGSAHYYTGLEVAARWHMIGKWVLLGLLGLHIVASLWHALWLKDKLLQQMFGYRRNN